MQTQLAAAPAVPDHVPRALIWNHDVDGYAAQLDDPYRVARVLHDGPEIVWASGAAWGMPGWLPTRFALVDEVFRDFKRFTSRDQTETKKMLDVDWALNPLEFDPPEHGVYRRILQPLFQPSVVNQRDARLRAICDDLMRPFLDKGGCEFVADFSTLFPSHVFLHIMGMPIGRLGEFRALEDGYVHETTFELRAEAMRAIMRVMGEIADEKRRSPGDDIISHIVTTELDGRPLNKGEVLGMCMLLYFGGLDTVVSQLGWYLRHLAQDQPLQARLRADPGKIPRATEEFLRLYGSTVSEDCEFHGVQMKAGDRIALPVFLAHRDPRQYSNPDQFDLDRPARHITFATGAHNCLGVHFARREINIVLERFLACFDNIRIAEGASVTWHTQGGSWGLDRLPLVWERRTAA